MNYWGCNEGVRRKRSRKFKPSLISHYGQFEILRKQVKIIERPIKDIVIILTMQYYVFYWNVALGLYFRHWTNTWFQKLFMPESFMSAVSGIKSVKRLNLKWHRTLRNLPLSASPKTKVQTVLSFFFTSFSSY